MDTLAIDPGPALLAPTDALRAGALDAGTAFVAAAPKESQQAARREGFRIGNLHFMLRYEDGSELADMPLVCCLPEAPSWFLGMTNLHGALVPVFDPAARWGAVHDPAATPMLLVLGHGDLRAGIVIDGLPTRLKPTPADRLDEAAVPEALDGCVAATHRIDDHDWMDLNCAALLDRLQRDLAD